MPENLMIKEPDFDISLTYQKTDKEIVYKKVFIFKNGVIKISDLPKWNAFYKNLLSNYNQQITLTK
jgi:hypothetical protein